MKKGLALVLALALLLCCCTVFSAATDGIVYNYRIEDGGAVIEEFDQLPAGDVVIPDTLGGYPVTKIEDYVFYQAKELTSVTIPATVEHIGVCVFYYCPKLTGIYVDKESPCFSNDAAGVLFNKEKTVLLAAPGAYQGSYSVPDTVTEIGQGAFKSCQGLTQVEFSAAVESIGVDAFAFCSGLSELTVPGNVTEMGRNAFFYCTTLSQLTLGSGVSFLDEYAFQWCVSLREVTLPETLSSFSGLTFDGCNNLRAIKVHPDNPWYADRDGIVYSKDMTLLCCAPTGFAGGYVAPDGLTEVGAGAFASCMGLTSVVLPDSVLVIGPHAFENCYYLESVYAGKGVQIVWDSAFAHCAGLKKVMLGDKLLRIADYAFTNCPQLADLYYLGNREQWSSVSVGAFNAPLQYVQMHFEADMPKFLPGDLDQNEIVDENDAVYLLQFVLMSEMFPVNQPVDFDGSGSLDEDDAIYLLQHVLMPDMFPLTSPADPV